MRHGDAEGSTHLPSVWIHERRTPKTKAAAVGRLGTIAQCVPGDVVACESLDGKRVIYLEIAWLWKDGKASQVRVYDFREREISTRPHLLRTVQNTQRVRWLGVRAR